MTENEQATIPLDVSDFVMAPETLIEKYGGMCALVYGRIWRYAQQESGTCTASHSTIAKALHTSRQTVQKYVALLVSEGYLNDVTPDGAEHATNHYATTPYMVFSGRITATVGGTPVKKFDRGVKKVDRGVSKILTGGVKNFDIKKELKKDFKENLSEEDDDEVDSQLEESSTDTDSSSSSILSKTLKTITGVNSSNKAFKAALKTLIKSGIDSDRLILWFKDDDGWPAARPSNAERKQPWPSQVAQMVPGWRTKYEGNLDL